MGLEAASDALIAHIVPVRVGIESSRGVCFHCFRPEDFYLIALSCVSLSVSAWIAQASTHIVRLCPLVPVSVLFARPCLVAPVSASSVWLCVVEVVWLASASLVVSSVVILSAVVVVVVVVVVVLVLVVALIVVVG